MEKLIDEEGWPIDEIVDKQGKFTAFSLSCYLNHLECAHLCDLKGANIHKPVGKLGNTPLMNATINWNVNIVDYLIERGADPYQTDIYGFTATRKAELR